MALYRCPECGNRIAVDPFGIEYGHERGLDRATATRCPLRPDCVDPRPRGERAQLPPTVRGLLVLALGLAVAVAIAALEGGAVT